jgi:dihydropteroate synthase
MAQTLRWRGWVLDLAARTHVMGVLNVTPDSFSDGGLYLSPEAAVRHGMRMADEGADIIDIGGESSRPFSKRISVLEEMKRVLPVIEALASRIKTPISIDTLKAEVAKEAIRCGASMINDISALRYDPKMAEVAAEAGVPVVLMHMKGSPEDMQINPVYKDVTAEVAAFLMERMSYARECGIERGMLIVDPGIGFGKTIEHNLTLIRELAEFKALQAPILLGTSNKSFIGRITGKEPSERVIGTMATVAAGVMNGADIVRVHNVKEAVDTVRVIDAIMKGHVTTEN